MAKAIIPKRLWNTLGEVLAVPTASYHEQWLIDYLTKRLTSHAGVSALQDTFGNLVLRYRPKKGARARFAFQAHLDHPGFVIEKKLKSGDYLVQGIGGHGNAMVGAKIRFFSHPEDTGQTAQVISQKELRRGLFELVVRSTRELAPESVGMWNFPPLSLKGRLVSGRSFDDTLGVALLVAVLEDAVRGKYPQAFDLILTRAEEAGLHGVLALMKQRKVKLPRYIINVEMPYARADFTLGEGAMIRVGDKLSTFDFELVSYFDLLAESVTKRKKSLKFQKQIASKGFTEVSVFAVKGYQSAALCLPVRHAHNISDNDGKPAAEGVDANDLLSLYLLLREIAKEPFEPKRGPARVWERVQNVALGLG